MFRAKKKKVKEKRMIWKREREGVGVQILWAERTHEWTQIIAGMRKVDQLVKRKGEKKRWRGIQRGSEAKWMFWDNSTDEMRNEVDGLGTCH